MAGECVKMEDRRKDCQFEFDRVWERLDKGSRVMDKLNDDTHDQAGDIKVLKTQISSLIGSIGGLTKALWGIVVAVAVGGIGFIIWYIQSGGFK